MINLLTSKCAFSIPFWVSEWFDISFKKHKLISSRNSLPSSHFYRNFYKLFFERYRSFSELPNSWRGEKEKLVEEISKHIHNVNSLLSIGSGNCYVENALAQYLPDLRVYSYDTFEMNKSWLQQFQPNLMYSCQKDLLCETYDAILINQVCYSLSLRQCNELFLTALGATCDSSRIVLIHTSLFPHENGVYTQNLPSFVRALAEPIKQIFRQLTLSANNYQFWGWKRSNKFYIKKLEILGFKCESAFSVPPNNSLIIFSRGN